MELEAQLADRSVTIDLSDEARKWLGVKGYDPQMGARPLGRVIQENLKKPMAEEILFGKLMKGGIAKVRVEADRLAFEFIAGNAKANEETLEDETSRDQEEALD